MSYPKDLTGLKFHHLTAVSKSNRSDSRRTFWQCSCDCGNTKIIRRDHLVALKIKSCSCIGHYGKQTRKRQYHGKANTPEYVIWQDMKGRCSNPEITLYHGKGITVCRQWQDSFLNFLADMGYKPSPKHSIDRINNDGNYEPSNCRWSTPKQQANNTSRNRIIPFDGKNLYIQQWAALLGMKWTTLRGRLDRGWTIEQTLTIPVKGGHLKNRI